MGNQKQNHEEVCCNEERNVQSLCCDVMNDEECCAETKDEECCATAPKNSDPMKNKLASRLNIIEGQIRGVKGMIEKEVCCDSVLTQIAAIQSSLNSVSTLLLECHLKSCVKEDLLNGNSEAINSLIKTINRFMK